MTTPTITREQLMMAVLSLDVALRDLQAGGLKDKVLKVAVRDESGQREVRVLGSDR